MRSFITTARYAALGLRAPSDDTGADTAPVTLSPDSPVASSDAPPAGPRTEVTEDNRGEVFSVPVVKAGPTGKPEHVIVDIAALPDRVWRGVIEAGLKIMVNGGASSITKASHPNDSERFKVAFDTAKLRVTDMYGNVIKIASDASFAKESAATMTEARRIAKEQVKAELRAAGLKISSFDASEITRAANDLIKADPEILATAKANLAKRPGAGKVKGIVATLKPDAAKVAAAEAKKTNKIPADVLSAKQAGKVAPHASRH